MSLIVFLDETGDHSLEAYDKNFPYFAVILLACERDAYTHDIVPSFYDLKHRFCGHEGLILHSRDIRKQQKGFEFLRNAETRAAFYTGINRVMSDGVYRTICTVIKKQEHKSKYGRWARNPYDLALTFCLERLLPMLESAGQSDVLIIAEARGKNEDAELKASFERVIHVGTDYIRSERFESIKFQMEFLPKSMNIIGTQMADLVAYPIVTHVMRPDHDNLAFEIVKDKIYRGSGNIYGLKVFP